MFPWFLRPYQLDIYASLHSHKFPVVEASRQIGKTTTELVFVNEYLIKNPGHVWRWCEPWKYQAREIVMPAMDALLQTCPKDVRPKFRQVDSYYEFPNGSRLYLRGVNEDKGESSRGAFAHGITADELGSWKDPEYILNEVLLPQLLSTRGVMHKLSTPPRDLGHYWYAEFETAQRDGRATQTRISDTGDTFTAEEIDLMCQAAGGPMSPSWRREFMLERVADPDLLVVPEYTEALCELPDEWPRPECFDVYVGGDSGTDDNTVIAFGYYDFERDWDVIEDELVMRGKESAEIVAAAKLIEARLFGEKRPFVRVYDAAKQLLLDITSTHKYSVVLPRKDDRHAAIHQWRLRVGQGKFKVKKRCQAIHRQMKVGMWRDDKKLDFQRSPELGHLDAVAASLYFSRSIVRNRNPWPALHGFSSEKQFIASQEKPVNPQDTLMLDAFRAPLGPTRGKRGSASW